MRKAGKEIQYARCEGVDVRQVDGEAFFVGPATKAVHHLNPIATAFWNVLEKPRALQEVADIFAAAFPEIPHERLEADLESLCVELERVGLIQKQSLKGYGSQL
jgi:hypothetical protein